VRLAPLPDVSDCDVHMQVEATLPGLIIEALSTVHRLVENNIDLLIYSRLKNLGHHILERNEIIRQHFLRLSSVSSAPRVRPFAFLGKLKSFSKERACARTRGGSVSKHHSGADIQPPSLPRYPPHSPRKRMRQPLSSAGSC
jgi:hypothetical protein